MVRPGRSDPSTCRPDRPGVRSDRPRRPDRPGVRSDGLRRRDRSGVGLPRPDRSGLADLDRSDRSRRRRDRSGVRSDRPGLTDLDLTPLTPLPTFPLWTD